MVRRGEHEEPPSACMDGEETCYRDAIGTVLQASGRNRYAWERCTKQKSITETPRLQQMNQAKEKEPKKLIQRRVGTSYGLRQAITLPIVHRRQTEITEVHLGTLRGFRN